MTVAALANLKCGVIAVQRDNGNYVWQFGLETEVFGMTAYKILCGSGETEYKTAEGAVRAAKQLFEQIIPSAEIMYEVESDE